MIIKNKITDNTFDLPESEVARILENSRYDYEIVGATREDLDRIEKSRPQKPVTLEDKLLGNIEYEKLNYKELQNLAKERKIKYTGVSKEDLIKELSA